MKRIIVFFVAVSLLMQSFGAAWVFAGFYSNRAFIVSSNCTYRNYPVNTCKGICILMKQLIKVQDRSPEKINLKGMESPVLIMPNAIVDFRIAAAEENLTRVAEPEYPRDLYNYAFSLLIFHPPLV